MVSNREENLQVGWPLTHQLGRRQPTDQTRGPKGPWLGLKSDVDMDGPAGVLGTGGPVSLHVPGWQYRGVIDINIDVRPRSWLPWPSPGGAKLFDWTAPLEALVAKPLQLGREDLMGLCPRPRAAISAPQVRAHIEAHEAPMLLADELEIGWELDGVEPPIQAVVIDRCQPPVEPKQERHEGRDDADDDQRRVLATAS
jgi:hypothetical protein